MSKNRKHFEKDGFHAIISYHADKDGRFTKVQAVLPTGGFTLFYPGVYKREEIFKKVYEDFHEWYI